MSIVISVLGPSAYENAPVQVQIRASGDYNPEIFNDLANRVVDLYHEIAEGIELEDDPDMPPDPDHDADQATG